MRIVLDLQACQASSMHRGIGRYSIALALAMARNSGGHELRLVLNAAFPDSVTALRQAFAGLLPAEHITTYELPGPVDSGDPGNAWRVRAAERIREHYLTTLRPDVVHVASLFEGFSDDAVSSVMHGAGQFDTAVTLYDLIPLMRKARYLSDPTVRAWYYRKLQSLKNAELLLAISGHSRSEALAALQLPPERVINISSAVDTIFQPRQLGQDALAALRARYALTRPFIMYTGGIDYRKNIEGLIDAYAALPAPLRRQYQLAIVCSVSAGDRARLLAHGAGVGLAGDDLILTGFVPDDDLVALYNATALFVFPSLQEGFGLPALEAMACGAPVIGSNNSSIPEVIGRADALFDPNHADQITAAMVKVLDQPDFAASLRAHGPGQARQFSWEASARTALDGFEELHRRRQGSAGASVAMNVAMSATMRARRPRLAFVSPLPPERSGIAGYSAELLPELARYYDIELVLAQEQVSDDWVSQNFPCRTVQWFDQHAANYDYIVYQFGNSTFHQHMFALLERHPGIVVLHDFFLSGVINSTAAAAHHPHEYWRTLYQAHGYQAVADDVRDGREASKLTYPCNREVLTQAAGVIVHSAYSATLAEQWYGPGSAARWRQIPLLRVLPDVPERAAARRALGIADDDFVVCSFGMLAISKCNARLVEAWLASALAGDARCHLVFVGENSVERYGNDLAARIATHPRIRITGFADDATYRQYLCAADAAVQLRTHSRGETSAAVLDCLAYRLPTIINAHGSAAEVPGDVCLRLDDDFSDHTLTAALERLFGSPQECARLAASAQRFMHTVHHPARVGELYRDAIEALSAASPVLAYRRLLASLATIDAGNPGASDLRQCAAAIAANEPLAGQRQLLVDVTHLRAEKAPGRRAALAALVLAGTREVRVEPVYRDGHQWRYARTFTLALIGCDNVVMADGVADARGGDVMLAREIPPAWALRGVGAPAAAALPPALLAALAALD